MIDLKTLNTQQIEAITHGDGPLMIIAGAGTGKTTVITERIKHLILEKEIPASHILALTFTEKAAKEMEERVDIAMPYGYTQMWIATFHGFCDRILRQEAISIGLTPNYKMLTEAESILFLKQHLFDLQLNYFRPLGNPTKFLSALLGHMSRLKDEDISPEQYLEYANRISNFKFQISNKEKGVTEVSSYAKASEDEGSLPVEASAKSGNDRQDLGIQKLEAEKWLELARVYKAYEELKVKEGIMDFGDLIANTLSLFRKKPNILAAYQNQFRYILIDEFQDTNYAQNELALLLSQKSQNITVVGDDDQAIYRWRGAALSNMVQFRSHFPQATIVTLTKNYRSTANILDSAYKTIQYNNPDRLEVKEHIDKRLTAERGLEGDKVQLLLSDTVDNEAEAVVKKIQEIAKKEKKQWKDFAILVRANDHAQPFMRTLDRNRIPYQFLGPGQLFHQDEIKDLIAFLKVLYNFEDASSLYRVLTMPVFEISGVDIAALLNYTKKVQVSLFNALTKEDLPVSEKGKETFTRIATMLTNFLERVPKETAGQLVYAFLEETGLLKEYITVTTQEEELRSQNIAKFFDKLKSYEAQHDDASIFAVVDWIELSMQMGESPLAASGDWSENNAVNILTVHSSKGLEFPVVFITNLVTQRFPSRERREQIPIPTELVKEILPEGDFHLQEERRLFYVAATRARDTLFLTSAQLYGEGKRERKISPFILEAMGIEEVEKAKQAISHAKTQLPLIEMFPKLTPADTKAGPEDHQPLAETTNITYISYSQIQTFDMCPLHYKLKYLLNVPTPPTASQSFGTSVHSTLREFYLRIMQGEKVGVEDIQGILESVWIPEGYSSKKHEEQARSQALTLVTTYLEDNFDPINLPIGLEIPFQFSIGSLKVGGRIDRIDRVDPTKLEIIDYKTGNNIPTDREVEKNLQLTMYGLAATEIRDPLFGKKPEEVLLSLYYLEERKKISTTRTREQLEEAKITILEKARAIEQSDFRCNHSIFCQNCEYKMLCESN